jgi:hypothetical protein
VAILNANSILIYFTCWRGFAMVGVPRFASDRMSHIILRCPWFHTIIQNVHSPTEDKTDDVKDSFYEELERVFDKFPK